VLSFSDVFKLYFFSRRYISIRRKYRQNSFVEKISLDFFYSSTNFPREANSKHVFLEKLFLCFCIL